MPNPDESTRDTKDDPELQNEGEGSRTAARRYDEAVEKTVKSGKVDELARKAEEALDGEEGDELRDAEERGKRDEHR